MSTSLIHYWLWNVLYRCSSFSMTRLPAWNKPWSLIWRNRLSYESIRPDTTSILFERKIVRAVQTGHGQNVTFHLEFHAMTFPIPSDDYQWVKGKLQLTTYYLPGSSMEMTAQGRMFTTSRAFLQGGMKRKIIIFVCSSPISCSGNETELSQHAYCPLATSIKYARVKLCQWRNWRSFIELAYSKLLPYLYDLLSTAFLARLQ